MQPTNEQTSKFLFGLDLGQVVDYTAVTIFERLQTVTTTQVCTARDPHLSTGSDWQARRTFEPAVYHLRHIERMRGEDYPAVVARVQGLVRRSEVGGRYALIVDHTGVGRPIFDMFTKAGLDAYGVSITGGAAVSKTSKNTFAVSKQVLVATTQVITQAKEPRRIVYAEGLTGLMELKRELSDFRVHVTKNANETYEAREGAHDDLVLSVALALWFGETYGNPPRQATCFQG
jgi:hypothetical protein